VFFTPAAVNGWRGPVSSHPLFQECFQAARAGDTSAEATCGRPLGVRIVGRTLFVADAYFGIFSAPLDGGAPPAWLVRPEDATPALRFLNDLDASVADGSIYFSDSSSRTSRQGYLLAALENAPAGRLFRKPPGGAPLQLVADGLHFPNGVQLLPDERALVVCELGRLRLLRCALPLPCKLTVFADALPGLPDNVRLSADRRALLVGAGSKVAHPFSLFYHLWTNASSSVDPAGQQQSREDPPYGLVLKLALDGTPLGSLHDVTGRVAPVSHAHEQRDGTLWLGSATNAFAARVPPPAAARAP
jgi:hypothetical protein